MNAETMQRTGVVWNFDRTIEEAALFKPVGGDIDLLGMENGIF